jgi:hypothetical protein
MYLRRASLLSLALVLLLASAFAADRPWREIRAPHFRVITNGSEGAGRHVAREFEQMRALFAIRFPGFRLDSAEPLLIVAPENEITAIKLLPEFWKYSGPKPAGVYFHSWEQPYALVRLDSVGSAGDWDQFAVTYHEYIHSLLHLNFRWIPTWLDEGLAEFYAYTRFEGKYTLIGAPPRNTQRLALLQDRSPIPLAKFLDQRGSFTHSEEDTQLYYAQAWALTHYLTMSAGMDFGSRLNKFFNAIQKGADQKKAFQDTFGDFTQVQNDFNMYIRHFAFNAGQMLSPAPIEDKDLASRTLSPAETDAELASFYLATHQSKLARESSDRALKNDANLAAAHQTMGFLLAQEGKDEDAVREFSRAVDLDQKMYRSIFAKTMLSNLPHSTNAEDRQAFRSRLVEIMAINPQFAPAYIELAKHDVATGDPSLALGPAMHAETLEPWRAGYHLLSGQILLRMDRATGAAANAVYVAERWPNPDHDEAIELWNLVPADKRPTEAPPQPALGSDVSRAEGIVKSVNCGEKTFAIVLEKPGNPSPPAPRPRRRNSGARFLVRDRQASSLQLAASIAQPEIDNRA